MGKQLRAQIDIHATPDRVWEVLTDRRLQELEQAGWTDGQLVELTVAAAFGASKRRLDAGLRALGEAAGTRPPAGEG